MKVTQQLVIIHLSDIHFSDHNAHRFAAGPAVGSGMLPGKGFPTLSEKLAADLSVADPGCPVIVCITGDLTDKASSAEFREASEFVRQLAKTPIFGVPRGLDSIFVVPGNHDVSWDLPTVEERWQNWTNFHNETFGTRFDRHRPSDCVRLHDRVDDLGAVVLCLNSAEYVVKDAFEQKASRTANRGAVDQDQLTRIKDELLRIPKPRLESAIRIALVHHHPVLIPGLADPGQGYDAVENSGFLLNELRNVGFHLILHGHKHQPYHFSEDSFNAFKKVTQPPLTIVAGGSANSRSLPEGGRNCYNQISIKWLASSRQGRVYLQTRGLRTADEHNNPLLPSDWRWIPLLSDDRHIHVGSNAPVPKSSQVREFDNAVDSADDALRHQQYQALRYNMPVCEVMPSLRPGQNYEVRLWIEPHNPQQQAVDRDVPAEVMWSAGARNQVMTVERRSDPTFCARLNYYGPMLVQAKLRFPDGTVAYGYVYARMPRTYS